MTHDPPQYLIDWMQRYVFKDRPVDLTMPWARIPRHTATPPADLPARAQAKWLDKRGGA